MTGSCSHRWFRKRSPGNTSSAFTTYNDHERDFHVAPSNALQGKALSELVAVYGNSLRQRQTKAIEIQMNSARLFFYNVYVPAVDRDVQRVKVES
jgi:hypothetical protein